MESNLNKKNLLKLFGGASSSMNHESRLKTRNIGNIFLFSNTESILECLLGWNYKNFSYTSVQI